MCAGPKETCTKLKYRGMVYIARRMGKAGWSTGGGAGCLEQMTVPKDLSHFICEAEHLTIAVLFEPAPLGDVDSSGETNNIESSADTCWRLSPKNKYSIGYVELFIARWRTWGRLGAASLCFMHITYTFAILYQKREGSSKFQWKSVVV